MFDSTRQAQYRQASGSNVSTGIGVRGTNMIAVCIQKEQQHQPTETGDFDPDVPGRDGHKPQA